MTVDPCVETQPIMHASSLVSAAEHCERTTDVPAKRVLNTRASHGAGKPVALSKLCKLQSVTSQGRSSPTQHGPDPSSSSAHPNGPEAPPSATSYPAGRPGQEQSDDTSAQPANLNEPVLDLPALETGMALMP